MDDIYISHYQPTERTRRSVLAVKANNKTIDDVYQHDSRLKPHFEGESFSGALGTVTVMVEGVCLVPVVGNDRAVCASSFLRLRLQDWRHGGLSCHGGERSFLPLTSVL